MDQINYSMLHKLHPCIRKFVTYLLIEGKMGICSRDIQILQISSSKKNNEDTNITYGNIFNVLLPYAGRYVECEVKFSNDDMTFAPDFYLLDDACLTELKPELIRQKLPSWTNWNAADHTYLYRVLMEILRLYKLYQIHQLTANKYSRVHFEYTALMGTTPVTEDQVEVFVESSDVVHFLIALSIDCTSLPPGYVKNAYQLEKNIACLMITFLEVDGSNVHTQIFFSEYIDQKLLGFENLSLPIFSKDDYLMDYVPAIQKYLQEKINSIIYIYTSKKSYFVELLNLFSTHILEYDSINHSKVTLLFETAYFHWLLIIDISNYFPEKKPKWTMRSIYDKSWEPVTAELKNYPYNPRWCTEKMIMKALQYAVEMITQFKFITYK